VPRSVEKPKDAHPDLLDRGRQVDLLDVGRNQGLSCNRMEWCIILVPL